MKKDILYNAIENFTINSKFNLEFDSLPNKNNDLGGKLNLIMDNNEFDFMFEIKKNLTLSKLPSLQYYLDGKNNIILISDYIPKLVKEHLKEKNISYLDTSGNAFITNGKSVFIYLETNKTLKFSSKKSNRAFSKSGLKVIYQILINKEIINMPYRYIGQASKVSIDTVGKVFKELLRDKYLIQIREKEFKIQNKERLIQEWTTVFNRVLRPKLRQRNFKPKDFTLSELLYIPSLNSIGGELAAEFLSNYLIAENAIIYTDRPFIDIAREFNLIPATDGSITLVEKFWTDEQTNYKEITVNPILVYADLLNDPKPRNLETAKMIYDKDVKNIL